MEHVRAIKRMCASNHIYFYTSIGGLCGQYHATAFIFLGKLFPGTRFNLRVEINLSFIPSCCEIYLLPRDRQQTLLTDFAAGLPLHMPGCK